MVRFCTTTEDQALKRFTKAQQASLDDAIGDLTSAGVELSGAIERYNTAINDAWTDIETGVEQYNEAAQKIRETYREIAEAAQEYYDASSDNWQTGDAGQAYQSWIDDLENVDIEDVEFDQPDEIDNSAVVTDEDALSLPEPQPES